MPPSLDFSRPALDDWLARQNGLAEAVSLLAARDPIGEPDAPAAASLRRLAAALADTAAAPDRDRRLDCLGQPAMLDRLGRLLGLLDAGRRVRLLCHLNEDLGEAGRMLLRRLLQRHGVGGAAAGSGDDALRITVEYLYRRALLQRLFAPERLALLRTAFGGAGHA